jgi:hypothetical protein
VVCTARRNVAVHDDLGRAAGGTAGSSGETPMASSRSKHKRTIMKNKQRRKRQEKRRQAAAKEAAKAAPAKAPAAKKPKAEKAAKA